MTRPVPGAPGPSTTGTRVVAAWWVSAMKTGLSDVEFRKVVGEYERYLREGGEFDKKVVECRYWRWVRGIE